MASVTLLPYRHLGEAIDLHLSSTTGGVSVDDQTVRFEEGAKRVPFTLEVKCSIAASTLAPLEELGHTPKVVLQMQSISSRLRTLVAPARIQTQEEVLFTLELDPAEHLGTIQLLPLLVNTHFDTRDPSTFGRILGWGTTVSIEIDEPSRPLGSGLPVLWHSFEADDGLPNDHLFHVRMDEPPTILLNRDITGFEDVLKSNGTTGRKARIRDSVFALIAHQVWTSLIAECLFDIESSHRDNPDLTLAEHCDALPDWKRSVVRDWFAQLLDLGGMDEALPDELPTDVLSERLPRLIQTRLRTPRMSFVGLHADSGLFTAGDEE